MSLEEWNLKYSKNVGCIAIHEPCECHAISLKGKCVCGACLASMPNEMLDVWSLVGGSLYIPNLISGRVSNDRKAEIYAKRLGAEPTSDEILVMMRDAIIADSGLSCVHTLVIGICMETEDTTFRAAILGGKEFEHAGAILLPDTGKRNISKKANLLRKVTREVTRGYLW